MKMMRTLVALIAAWMILGVSVAGHSSSPLSAAEQELMQAAFDGSLDDARRLITSGIAVDATDVEKRTSLMWASFNGHAQVVGFLLDSGAAVNARDASGRTALLYASSGPYAETVALLLDKGADVNVQGTLEGFTALMTAAAEGQLQVVRLLLDHGADPRLLDKDGDTAESFARQKGHVAVEVLLKDRRPKRIDRFPADDLLLLVLLPGQPRSPCKGELDVHHAKVTWTVGPQYL
jgi:ankyrin repeat protein